MSLVLVDSSVWIEFFRGSKNVDIEKFNTLIDNNQICINELIISELFPSLIHKKEFKIVELLKTVRTIPIKIDWNELIDYQTINLKNGINNIGIPDLIIMQNSLQNDLLLYSLDKHFQLLKKIHKCKLFTN